MEKNKKFIRHIGRAAAWLIIWEILNILLSDKIIFAGPAETFVALWHNLARLEFYIAVWTTFFGIAAGFGVSIIACTVIASAAYKNELVDFFVTPVIDFCRYIPTITFTLAAILWSDSSVLAFEVSVFLSVPVIYKHFLAGLRSKAYKKGDKSEFVTGCHRALNMCWKSGIVAQIIGNTRHSIGSMLYIARDEKDMAQIFAWTIVIVLLSVAFEHVVLRIMSFNLLSSGTMQIDDVYEHLEDEDISL